MLDKLLTLLIRFQARRDCLEQGHRPGVREIRWNGSSEIRVTAPCMICGAQVPVMLVTPELEAAAPPLPVVLRAVGGSAARIAGSRDGAA